MSKRDVLQELSFGKQIAEQEVDELASYFVETDQWRRIFAGEVDIVYGAKGSGKSALYSLLQSRAGDLRSRGVVAIAAENPRGTPVFRDLVADPPTSENEFRALWKLYFLALAAKQLLESGADGRADEVVRPLLEAGLVRRNMTLKGLLRSALDYARSILHAESVEGGLKIDPHTGLPSGVTGKITLREPTPAQQKFGLISADTLFDITNKILADSKLNIWILLDRLDVAFADSDDLEKSALRALFRVYLDLLAYPQLSLKIFLRTDIWRRITQEGFREASHITRHVYINWESQSLLNLVVRRALRSLRLREFYNVAEASVLNDAEQQRRLFYRIFPAQVDAGGRRPPTLDWLLSRTRDGSGETAPRELIHLLIGARDVQLKQLELGEEEPREENLFDRTALRGALPEVSKVRLEQTIYAENPKLRPRLEQLIGEKTEQTPETLAKIWRVPQDEALAIATELAEIGFFEAIGSKDQPAFWVPFLYRDALDMVQGAADR